MFRGKLTIPQAAPISLATLLMQAGYAGSDAGDEYRIQNGAQDIYCGHNAAVSEINGDLIKANAADSERMTKVAVDARQIWYFSPTAPATVYVRFRSI